ncbi:MAG: sigma-54 dependent transcriptional regulator [Tannerella sp.]|jgi:DNA-binding NtrC family response regulator|nr:sigma-54 dependent transcriptional regulator [Tannerella sp.]
MKISQANILIIDDDKDILTAAGLLLKPEAKHVITDSKPENIHRLLTGNNIDVVLLDMNFNSTHNTGNEGLFWLQRIKEWSPSTAVILITAYGEIDLAVAALKKGASDFIVKPWYNEKLIEAITGVLPEKSSKKPIKKENTNSITPGIIGKSQIMRELFYKIGKIAPTDANVLILGENGTGKDLVARAIHEQSLRKNKPFVKVDVGSISESLFESELFGHVKGAFTDAREDRIGRFEAAHGGTLFLDEIGNIPLAQQSKLLTVLQNRIINRVGSNTPVPIDIRLVCATNVPINELADEQRFRKDLIYRINTVEITIPPLRVRGTDITLLANHFTLVYGNKYMKQELRLSKDAKNKLQRHRFPGNVRELQYCIERAVILSDSDELQGKDIIFSPIEFAHAEQEEDNSKLIDVERNTILRVIEKHNGNISRAAKELGLTRTALYRRLNKHNI